HRPPPAQPPDPRLARHRRPALGLVCFRHQLRRTRGHPPRAPEPAEGLAMVACPRPGERLAGDRFATMVSPEPLAGGLAPDRLGARGPTLAIPGDARARPGRGERTGGLATIATSDGPSAGRRADPGGRRRSPGAGASTSSAGLLRPTRLAIRPGPLG